MNGENLVKKLQNAKTAEELKALLAEVNSQTKLSLDDLDRVAGGAPETFLYEGSIEMTQTELLNMINSVRDLISHNDATSMLLRTVKPYYSNYSDAQIVKAYDEYGNDMFSYLDKPGWKK